MMSQSRCTLSVRGLDCPNEVETLRAALEGSPGVTRLGFDLIHGLMTVDYETSVIDHEGLLRRVRERAGMQADLAGGPARNGESRFDVLVVAAWALGFDREFRAGTGNRPGRGLAGPDAGPGKKQWPEAGPGLLRAGGLLRGSLASSPRRSKPEEAPARYRRAHGTGDPGGNRAGAMGRGGDRGLPVRPLRVARVSEPGACPPGDPQPSGDRAPDR